jgi:hypothetical protein
MAVWPGAGHHCVAVDEEPTVAGGVQGHDVLDEPLDLEVAVADPVTLLLDKGHARSAQGDGDRDLLVRLHLAEAEAAERRALLEVEGETAGRQAAEREAAVRADGRRDRRVLVADDGDHVRSRGGARRTVEGERGRAADHRPVDDHSLGW